ncbi:MAG: PEP-CTERM sorting domain-containing protein [Planctomycetota bacterium]
MSSPQKNPTHRITLPLCGNRQFLLRALDEKTRLGKRRQPRCRSLATILGVVELLAFCGNAQANAPYFTGLGDLPGGVFYSYAYGVSADGTVVVGMSNSDASFPGQEAFRWEGGVMTGLGGLPGGESYSLALGVSADGQVVVGRDDAAQNPSGDRQAFRWTEATGMVGLGDLPGGDVFSTAYGASADGAVVVGVGNVNCFGLTEAFRWTQDQGMVGLGDLDGGYFYSEARAVSADGSVVVGTGYSDSGYEAFRWENGAMTGLGDLPGGEFYSMAYGISADGTTIIGFGGSGSAGGQEAFRWTEGQGMVGLGHLPGGLDSTALACSADGSIIAGRGNLLSGEDEAIIWDADNGMRSLRTLLVDDFGLDLPDWTLDRATGVSADGQTLIGWGYNPDGHVEAWIARIPEPATLSLLLLGGVMLRRRR